MSAFHIAKVNLSTERHTDTSEEACDSWPSMRSLLPVSLPTHTKGGLKPNADITSVKIDYSHNLIYRCGSG